MIYTIFNGPAPTTAAQAVVTTGTAIKTLLQIKATNVLKVVAWGISFDGVAASVIKTELLDTGTVNATVTASVDADIVKDESGEQGAGSVAGLTLATSGTGYTGSAEGTITAVKMFDAQVITCPAAGQGAIYVREFPLGREKKLIIGNILRVRVTATVAVNAYAWITFDI